MHKSHDSLTPILALSVFGLLVSIFGPDRGCRGEDWPQWMGINRDNVWRETRHYRFLPRAGAKVLWRQPVGGGYAGRSVQWASLCRRFPARSISPVSGRPKTQFKKGSNGLSVWTKQAVRSFGNMSIRSTTQFPIQLALVARPRSTRSGLHTWCSGNLYCLDAKNGSPKWSRNLPADYSTKPAIWGYAGHPLVIDDQLICIAGGVNSLVVAFDKHSGQENWRSLSSSSQGYSPPVLSMLPARDSSLFFIQMESVR